MNTTCLACNRPLSLTESVMRGLGAVCAAKADRAAEERGGGKVDLPFNAVSKDITCEVWPDGPHFNIHQVFRHHSPSGMGWGYGGSGPADYALNILELFVREMYPSRKPKVKLWDGQKVSWMAWTLHQRFKEAFVAAIPREGGTIRGGDVRAWLEGETGLTPANKAATTTT
jgi:hypothetical protein